MIEILTSGMMNSVQDLGRPGFLDQGIGHGGMMDRTALRIGNMLLGNDEGAAGLEIAIFPFRLRFLDACNFAVTGAAANTTLDGEALAPWWSRTATAGQELRIEPPHSGARIVLAFGGGIDVAPMLGSRSTDLKSNFGGLEGRGLRRGDRLALRPASVQPKFSQGHGADVYRIRNSDATALRVMPGAEFAFFTREARQLLLSTPYAVTRENNRQGMRLEGTPLTLVQKLELHSHGIMPGTVQVPPSGQPVIQLAEANTCGGYPKIGHVIAPDHWKLAQLSSGASITFIEINREQALEAIRNEALQIRRLRNLMPLVMTRTAD